MKHVFTLLFLLAFSVGFAPRALAQKPSVLIVYADLPSYVADVQAKLIATNQLGTVALFNAQSGTPTLAQLQAYNTVLVYSDYMFADPTALGNVLVDYINTGKGVVRSVFANTTITGLSIGGNFNADTYKALSDASQTQGTRLTLGTVAVPSHPIMQGVTSFDGGESSYRANSSLTSGATLIASWSNNSPLIAVKNSVGTNGARRADLNFFPPSSTARSDFWESTTDGAKIMANALVWVSNTCPAFTATLTNDGPLTCLKTSVTLTAGGGLAGATYQFSPGASQPSGPTSATASVTTAGPYSVTVTNPGGCSSVATTTVTSSTEPSSLSLTNDGPITCLKNEVTVTATATNFTLFRVIGPPGAHDFVRTETGITFKVFLSGTYSSTVSNSNNGCSATAVTVVQSNTTAPTATLSASPSATLTCAQTSLTLTASGGDQYTFNGPGIVSQASNQAVVNQAGLYSVTVTNGSTGCFSTTSITISQNTTPPIAGLTNNGPLSCTLTSVTLTASGGTSYTFTSPDGTVLAGSGNTQVVSSPGLYSLTVASANGCTSTTTTSVTSNTTAPTATLSASPSATLTCAQTSLTLTAGGGDQYTFSGPGIVSQEGSQALVDAAGVYSVTVTNGSTGCFSTTSITISQDINMPMASLVSSGTLTCAVTSVTLTASPSGQTYRFSPGAAQIGSTNQAVVSASGTYSVTVVYANGCSSVASTSVSQDVNMPMASLASSGTLTCTNTSVTLTASPSGQTYRFSAGASQIGSTNQATVTTSGLYSVTVGYANGCTSVASVSVSQDIAAPMVSITASPSLTINQGQSTTLTANVSGGTPPFNYGWSTGANSPSIVVNMSGPYSVTATGDNGCSGSASTTVTVSGPFAITAVTTVDCSPIQPNRFSLTFNPRYQSLNGSPVSFSVTNELFPTTQPGPYTLQLYSDNPTITLDAVQSGVSSSFVYNWLAACNSSTTPNTPPRVQMSIPSQTATVGTYFSYVIPDGTFTDTETPGNLKLSASGVPPGLSFMGATLSGTPSTTVGSPFSITITATDPGSLSVSTSFSLTVLPASGPPPTTAPFAITGVTTISCTPVSNRINLVFSPRYGGMTGQPIAFEVVNELAPTTDPAPYSLTLYRDNPVITLRATQTGSPGPVTFSYNWLAACSNAGQDNTPPQLNEPVKPQSATVGVQYSLNLSNTFIDQETPNQISLSSSVLPAGLTLSGKFISGTPSMSGVTSVTLTATDGGGLSTSTTFSITVNPGAATPPPSGTFSITGVTTVSCDVVSAGERRLTFTPRYGGNNGSPVSFSVVNEMAPTMNPGPYTLNLYTDNPVITLRAVQSGMSSQFSYNWLSACNGGARVSAFEEVPLSVVILGNPVISEVVRFEVRGAEGKSLRLSLTASSGSVVSEQQVERASMVETQTLAVGHQPAGVLLLQVSTPTHSRTVKVLIRE